MTDLVAKAEVRIHAPASEVWDALTNPDKIKQYFFGTNTDTDWKKGSPIFFRGEWQGHQYEDKGTILDVELGKRIQYNYWSSFSKLPDVPENYQVITYELKQEGGDTLLRLTQSNVPSEESRKHSEENWSMVLDGLKKMLEA